jgi:putative SOS response-associated peptidase YedK
MDLQPIRTRTFNARSETVRTKPAFRLSIKSKRCLVPVDGFFEWRDFEKKKYPYFIRLKGQSPFALAGIWDSWKDQATGEVVETFSILTTQANPMMEKIHNTKKRMPVILRKEDEQRYLDPGATSEEIDSMLNPYDENLMEAYTVSRSVLTDKQGVDSSEVIRFHYDPELID